MPAYRNNAPAPRAVSRAKAREMEKTQQVTVLILGALALLGFLLTM